MNHGVLFQPDIKAYFMVSYIPRTQDTMKQKKELEYNPDIAKNQYIKNTSAYDHEKINYLLNEEASTQPFLVVCVYVSVNFNLC